MKSAFIAVVCTFLAGCGASKQAQERLSSDEDAQCRSYGAMPGTPSYYDCRMRLNSLRVQAETLKKGPNSPAENFLSILKGN